MFWYFAEGTFTHYILFTNGLGSISHAEWQDYIQYSVWKHLSDQKKCQCSTDKEIHK
jgi:hypothetical protein